MAQPPLGESLYLIVDARYEKMRMGGVVRDAAVLSAIGIGPDERRRVLGVSCALSEAEAHWRAFLESLLKRGKETRASIAALFNVDVATLRRALAREANATGEAGA